MILIVTNRLDQTADYLILELKKRDVEYIRFNTEDFPSRVSLAWRINQGQIDGYFIFQKKKLKIDEIKSIWYRRPVSPIPDNKILDLEIQNFVVEESRTTLEGFWRTLNCFWISNPDKVRVAENKIYQLKIALELGFNVSPTVITNEVDLAKQFYEEQGSKIVYKSLKKGKFIREGRQKFIFTNPISKDHLKEIENIRFAPSLLQKYVNKNVELRITVIGDQVFAVSIDSQKIEESIHDWRRALHNNVTHKPIDIPSDLQNKCKLLTKKLGLEFGALDFILTPEGEYVFLEINPNGQWAWIQQLCPEIPLRETLADLLIKG